MWITEEHENLSSMIKYKSIFICGTDTGVGKTLVTGALLAFLQSNGINAGAYKPLESGCSPIKGMPRHLKRADSEFLKIMARMDDPIDTINPYYFKEPVTPAVAAQREGKKISFTKIKNNLEALNKKYNPILIEGAGGLLVPIQGLKTSLDLIQLLKTPVLVIARLGLGTLNHTLLTLEHLKRNHIEVLGVILNEITPAKTLAEKTNPEILKKYKAPILGIFPHVKRKTRNNLIHAISHLDQIHF